MSGEEISHTGFGPVSQVDVRAEMQVAITDWHRSPPALALALRQHRSATAPGMDGESPLDGQIARECIGPALDAPTAADFLREVGRRLPLYAAWHLKLLDEIAGRLGSAEELPTISQAYAELEAELRHWAEGLDEVTRAELEFAIDMLNRGNALLLKPAEQAHEPRPADVADLYRTAILVEFLLACLCRLVNRAERPPLVVQIIYNLRYAVLDYAAAVRRHRRRCDAPEAPGSAPSGAESDPEASFWATAGSLALAELGDGA